jgi:large subunit ribosomal protein L30
MDKYKITQVKSTIDRMEGQKRTVRALGFTKMHQSKEVEGTPQIMGMIKKVAHLLKIEKI